MVVRWAPQICIIQVAFVLHEASVKDKYLIFGRGQTTENLYHGSQEFHLGLGNSLKITLDILLATHIISPIRTFYFRLILCTKLLVSYVFILASPAI